METIPPLGNQLHTDDDGETGLHDANNFYTHAMNPTGQTSPMDDQSPSPVPTSHGIDERRPSTAHLASIPSPNLHLPNATDGQTETATSSVPPRYNSIDSLRNTRKPGLRKITRLQHSWFLEISAVVLNLAAVTTIVVLLACTNGIALSEYTFIISFNAVISILGAISRVSLGFAIGSCLGQGKWNFFRKPSSIVGFRIFEDASRGPWGSLQLLIWLRLRNWAVTGALITILLLGFEPFLQSIIYYDGEMERLTNPPGLFLSQSTRLDTGLYARDGASGVGIIQLPDNETVHWGGFITELDFGMVSAIYGGFYNRSLSSDSATPSFLCPTGNCTWPPFASIAICSACNDVTDQLNRQVVEGDDLGSVVMSTVTFSDSWLIHSLPYANLSNIKSGRVESQDAAPFHITPDAYMSAVAMTQPGKTLSFKNHSTIIAVAGIISADDSYINGLTFWNETNVTAMECGLWFCANVYEASVSNGVLDERLAGSWAHKNNDSHKPRLNETGNTAEEIAAFEASYNQTLWVKDVDILYTDLELWMSTEEAKKYGLPSPQDTSPDYLSFNITYNTIGSMMSYLWKEFFCLGEPIVWPNKFVDCAPPVAQALAESTNLSVTFKRAARSLTNWIRDQSDEMVPGGVGQVYVVRIRVNWGYLALPLATIVAGCGFILFTIFETRRLGLPPWKTDIIPAVLYALDRETRTKLRSAAATTQDGSHGVLLREAAKDTIVRLEREDGKPCLKAVKSASENDEEDADEGFDEIPLYVPEVIPDPSSTDYGDGYAASLPPRVDPSLQNDQGNPIMASGHLNRDGSYRSQGHAYW